MLFNRRRKIATSHFEALRDLPELRMPLDPGSEPVWLLNIVRSAARDALASRLGADGIETLVHCSVPVYWLAPFAAYAPAGVSAADRQCSEVLSLPIGPPQTQVQIERVIAVIRRCFVR